MGMKLLFEEYAGDAMKRGNRVGETLKTREWLTEIK